MSKQAREYCNSKAYPPRCDRCTNAMFHWPPEDCWTKYFSWNTYLAFVFMNGTKIEDMWGFFVQVQFGASASTPIRTSVEWCPYETKTCTCWLEPVFQRYIARKCHQGREKPIRDRLGSICPRPRRTWTEEIMISVIHTQAEIEIPEGNLALNCSSWAPNSLRY